MDLSKSMKMILLRSVVVTGVLAFLFGVGVGLLWRSPGLTVPGNKALFSKEDIREVASASPAALVATPRTFPGPDMDVTSERLKSIAWLREKGMLNVGVFYPNGLDPAFAKLYGLSSTDVHTLEVAIQRAKQKILGAERSAAKVFGTADSGSLTVEVPAQPGRGGEVYDELLNSFRTVLGPDRYSYFSEFSGSSFDAGLDNFGEQSAKYEITRDADSPGEPVYLIKKSFTLMDQSGTSNSRLPGDQIAKYFPVLAPLLPPSYITKPVSP